MNPSRQKTTSPVKLVFILSVMTAIVFSALTFLLDSRLETFPHLPDRGPAWYFWKLPNPTPWSRITAWGGYILHQLVLWFILFKARKQKRSRDRTNPWNMAALFANLFFMFLHLVQTHLFYDGLAQDVPIWTSQYSVIIMLVIILFMLIPRRGIFWGLKIKIPAKILQTVQKYHGVYISWALVYTFWFHPMEGDFAILAGFLYMFFLFIHLSMFGTRLHTNIYWITFLEFFVGIHGPAIALMNNQPIWPMFLFGFLFMFIFTQMHGLSLKFPVKIILLTAFIAGAGVTYFFRGFSRLYEIIFIPAALYGGTFALFLLAAVVTFFKERLVNRKKAAS